MFVHRGQELVPFRVCPCNNACVRACVCVRVPVYIRPLQSYTKTMERLGHNTRLRFIFFDEVSFISAPHLAAASTRTCKALRLDDNALFGDMHVIITGDFYQHGPPGGRPPFDLAAELTYRSRFAAVARAAASHSESETMRNGSAASVSHSASGRAVWCFRPQLSRFRVRFQTTVPR